MWLVGQNGEISHTAQRAIAHHSLPGLATLGHLHQWNGTAIHGTTLKTRGGPANRWGLKQVQQDGMCLWSAWEGAAASGLDSPEQGESIQRNYVIFDIAKQEGSPILKRSER